MIAKTNLLVYTQKYHYNVFAQLRERYIWQDFAAKIISGEFDEVRTL